MQPRSNQSNPPAYPPRVNQPPQPGMRRRARGTAYSSLQSLIDRLAPWSFWLAILAGFLALFLLVTGAFSYFAYFQITDRITPGVQVAGIDLSGKQLPDAAVEIHQALNLDRKIVLDDGVQPLTLPPADLGIQVDAVSTAQQAFLLGHRKDVFFRMGAFLTGITHGEHLSPVILFDETRARQTLSDISAQITVPAQDAAIQVQDGRLVALPSKIGYTLNIEETLAPILASPEKLLLSGYSKLVLMPLAPRVEDATAQLQVAQAFLDVPHALQAYDAVRDESFTWELDPGLLATWLAVAAYEDGVQLDLSTPAIEAYLATLSAQMGDGRSLDPVQDALRVKAALLAGETASVRVVHDPTTYTVQSGDTLLRIAWHVGLPFWKIIQANPGMDPDHLTLGQTLTIPSQDEMLPLPVVPNKRIEINIGQQRLSVFENGERLLKFVISTGIDRSPTQPGIFQVQTHELSAYASVWDLTMPHFLGIYEAWPGFMNGIHGLPTLSNGRRLWGSILGKPASYGCIIMDLDAAEWLYNWAEAGVVVEIQP